MRNSTILKLSMVLTFMGVSFSAYAVRDASIGGVSENLLGPIELITKLSLLACYIVGAALVMVAIAQYKIHRQSPKLVPLSTPITLLILGVIALLIPYGSNMFGESGSAVEQNKGKNGQENVLPLPDMNRKGPMLPLPSSQNSEQGNSSNSDDSTGTTDEQPSSNTGSGTGHWSSDPRYNR